MKLVLSTQYLDYINLSTKYLLTIVNYQFSNKEI